MNLPEPRKPADRSPVQISGKSNILILSDIHIPYHSRSAVELSVAEGKKRKADIVILNGDFSDNYSVSAHETNPTKRDIISDLQDVKEGLQWLQGQFPKARLIYKAGNHELWWDRYLFKNAPLICGLPTTTWKAQIDPEKSRWEYVDSLTAIKINSLLLLHGHEYKFAISNPVNAARGLFLRTKVTSMCGHFHQRSEHSEKDGNGRLITTWSTGCLCDLQPDYASRNNWSHGFAYVEADKSDFNVHNLRIINGKVCS
jgi:predicted phosphodiesterase